MFPQPPPPPPATDPLEVVRLSSLAAALARLNVNIPIEDLVKAVHDVEDEARRVRLSAEVTRDQRRAALPMLALQPNEPSAGLKFTTVSRFVPNPPKLAHVNPLAKERRHWLLELTEQAFPDGKVLDPFVLTY